MFFTYICFFWKGSVHTFSRTCSGEIYFGSLVHLHPLLKKQILKCQNISNKKFGCTYEHSMFVEKIGMKRHFLRPV